MSVVAGVSIAHQHARVEDIEAASVGEKQRLEGLRVSDPIREAFALETCNRVEAYVVTDDPETGRTLLAETLPELPTESVRFMGHEGSLRHLMRVACGLESLVLGEDQILGQLRDAYETARGVGVVGPVFEEAVTKAIHVGERARTETAINEGAVSLGSAAVELIGRERDIAAATALVVGAGEMGTLAARALASADVDELVVANRTVAKAEHVTTEVDVDAEAVDLGALPRALDAADVAVTATGSPGAVIEPDDLTDVDETLVVDIAKPRDVAPAAADCEGVDVLDLDSLESITESTRRQRREAAERVEALVDEEFDRLLDQFKRKRADDVIAAMYEGADYVKEAELQRALSQLETKGEFSDEQREVVESLADTLVNQLLAAPTKSLREAAAEDDWTTIHTALQLFDPGFDAGPDFAEVPPRVDAPTVAGGPPGADAPAESEDD